MWARRPEIPEDRQDEGIHKADVLLLFTKTAIPGDSRVKKKYIRSIRPAKLRSSQRNLERPACRLGRIRGMWNVEREGGVFRILVRVGRVVRSSNIGDW